MEISDKFSVCLHALVLTVQPCKYMRSSPNFVLRKEKASTTVTSVINNKLSTAKEQKQSIVHTAKDSRHLQNPDPPSLTISVIIFR